RDNAVMVLPLPDSPITPTISLGHTSRLMSSMTRASPRRVAISTRRLSIARLGGRSVRRWLRTMTTLLAEMRVESIAQAVAQQIETEHAQEHGHARHDAEPGRLAHEAPACVEHVAP